MSMTLDEVMQGWHWSGPDGEELAKAYQASEAGGTGILFVGVVGSGKTTAARRLALAHGGREVRCDVAEKVSALAWWREWALPDHAVMLDELGRDAVRLEWGNRLDVVARFLRELHVAWKEGEWTGRLYATTNLDKAGLLKAYDASVVERILEMCVVCRFGQGRRRLAGERSAEAAAAASEGRHGDRPGQTQMGFDGYAWGRYEEHGIDVRSSAFRAAWHGATRPGFVMDALRLMRVNLGVLTGDDCEMARAVFYGANSVVMGDYLRDAFVYGLCASPAEREAFFRGLKAYAAAVYRENERAQSAFRHENAHVFDGWRKRLDVGELFLWARDWLVAMATDGARSIGDVLAEVGR